MLNPCSYTPLRLGKLATKSQARSKVSLIESAELYMSFGLTGGQLKNFSSRVRIQSHRKKWRRESGVELDTHYANQKMKLAAHK